MGGMNPICVVMANAMVLEESRKPLVTFRTAAATGASTGTAAGESRATLSSHVRKVESTALHISETALSTMAFVM